MNALQSYSINADDTESELAAIPESPKSDSTLHGSSGGSLGELEDTPAAVTRSVSLHGSRTAATDITARMEWNNQNAMRKSEGSSRPTWFLGSEDDSHQVIVSLLIKNFCRFGLNESLSKCKALASPVVKDLSLNRVRRSPDLRRNGACTRA